MIGGAPDVLVGGQGPAWRRRRVLTTSAVMLIAGAARARAQAPGSPLGAGGQSGARTPAPTKPDVKAALEKLFAIPRLSPAPAPDADATRGDTAMLSPEERVAIGAAVQKCWTKDPHMLGVETMSVQLVVAIDAAGVARKAWVGSADTGRLGDPRFRAFAERAAQAVLDARCATLPLSPDRLGKIGRLTFRFKP